MFRKSVIETLLPICLIVTTNQCSVIQELSIFGINAFAQTIFYAFSFCVINWSLNQSESFKDAISLVGLNSLLLLAIIIFIPIASIIYTRKMSTKVLSFFFVAIVPVLATLISFRMGSDEDASLLLLFLGHASSLLF